MLWDVTYWDVLFWCGVALGTLIGILLIIMLIGCFFPRYHTVSRAVEIAQSPEIIWQTITDYAALPSWQRNVLRVERLDDRNGHEVWRETYRGNYGITLETTEAVAPKRLVRHIADDKGPFTGRWEFNLTPTETGCRITITEHGDIANPFFRFMARLFMNPAIYLEMYLEALAQKYGAETAVQAKN